MPSAETHQNLPEIEEIPEPEVSFTFTKFHLWDGWRTNFCLWTQPEELFEAPPELPPRSDDLYEPEEPPLPPRPACVEEEEDGGEYSELAEPPLPEPTGLPLIKALLEVFLNHKGHFYHENIISAHRSEWSLRGHNGRPEGSCNLWLWRR